jgi:uncharacterized Zn-binding protein involved in type VI secretion
MPFAARAGDEAAHGGKIIAPVTGAIAKVMIGKMPAACMLDPHVCPASDGPKPHGGGTITKGSATVMIGGKPAARVGDMVQCVGPTGTVIMGCTTVNIGG